ncbi:MAG: hypothetical protein LBG30_00955 [Odoribacteraceae bacterium]|jgi:hypothetical protein|nr:hypothetical protein [Odoribacteraceae bacterium]
MNYIQFYHGIAPTRIHKANKKEYIQALEESREKESNAPFRRFMAGQHLKTLREEINNYAKNRDSNFTLLF